MNFADLKSELARRGFDYLSDAALGRYVNDAYLVDVCEERDWLWLRATAVDVAPITIPILRSVRYVIDVSNQFKLSPLQDTAITDNLDTDLSTPGEPRHYYFLSPTEIATYPTSEASRIEVTYTYTPDPMTGSDIPVLPERFHTLICDAAVARAYEDDDEWDAAGVATERFMARLGVMIQTDSAPQHDRPDEYIVSNWDV